MTNIAIVLFRQDLRINDNPALRKAIDDNYQIIPLYIYDEEEKKSWPMGGASKLFLHHSLEQLDEDLKEKGSRLILKKGDRQKVIFKILKESKAKAIFWNRCYEPENIKIDKELKEKLKEENYEVHSFNASLLFEPFQILNKEENPYQVYTAFWKACMNHDLPRETFATPQKIPAPSKFPESDDLSHFELHNFHPWTKKVSSHWKYGEKKAHYILKDFLEDDVEDYKENRDKPSIEGTSTLSPYLHFGQISPFEIWHETREKLKNLKKSSKKDSLITYQKEIVWREFAYYLLYHFPHTTDKPLREKFEDFEWEYKKKNLDAWQEGKTGYPIVDAGMRQLWQTGWMHNRVRMIVASFLVKDLFIPWQKGAQWFWETLVDADLASNTLGWQWTAGCGADAAPYFRIFNPILQGEKFDPEGDYVKHWVPELKGLEKKWIQKPWKAPEEKLETAGIKLGVTYPEPIVDHYEARDKALAKFKKIKN